MKYVLIGTWLTLTTLAACAEKTLVDFFLPIEPRGKLVSEGIWGADNVLPRDIRNGLEDPDMSDWCYWDGNIFRDDDGIYHMYASRWTQTVSHGRGWNKNSKGIHAVSDHLLGPYRDLGTAWPQWRDGEGANVIALRMTDGRYAVISSEVTPGDVFVSDSPNGPWSYHGPLEIDYNGFYPALARYDELDHGAVRAGTVGHMANVMVITRPDGRYMIIARRCAPMISDDGILGPYSILADKAWCGVKDMPQFKNEDPTVWYSDGLYHIVVNHYGGGDITYHLTSEDGIHNWKNRGLAFHKDLGVFCYPDGTLNDWHIVQRPTVYVEDGLAKAFNFSVIDVHKGQDGGNDNHGSKIVVVPFDGEGFNKHITKTVREELEVAKATPPPSPWKSVNLSNSTGSTGYETEYNTLRFETAGTHFVYQKMSGDVSATVLVLSQDITKEPAQAALMFRDSLDPDAAFAWASISRPGGCAFETADKVITTKKLAPPYWLRMEKRGDKLTSYVSPSNRMNWNKTGETMLALGDEFYVGMAAASFDSGTAGLARFKDMDFHVWGDPVNEGIVNHTFPDTLPADGKITFEVEYECRQTSDVFVELEHVLSRQKIPPLQKRLKNKGVMELTYDVGPLKSGEMYWVVIKTLPMHGHESMAYQSIFKKVVVERT